MIQVSTAFREEMAKGNHNWLEYVDIYLSHNEVLHLTNKDIWGGSLSLDDSVSEDGTFGAIGATIINSLSFTINNINDEFSDYNFYGKSVRFYVGLELPDGTIERFQKGEFLVADVQNTGFLISLTCYDAMAEFDRYVLNDWGISFPRTIRSLLNTLCGDIGYTLATQDFPNADYVIASGPSDPTKVTGREIISWCATIAGCFARFNRFGELEIGWFDQASLMAEAQILNGGVFDSSAPKYSTGDDADGGGFDPWDIGYEINMGGYPELSNIHNIYSIFSHSIAQNNVRLTGVEVTVDTDTQEESHHVGTYVYYVEIPKNEFITNDNYLAIARGILNKISDFTFRSGEATCVSDPTIEAGDVAFLWDSRTRVSYPIIISRTVFSVGNPQQIYSSAQAPSILENGLERQTEASKNYADTLARIGKEKTAREAAINALSESLANSAGLYSTIIPAGQKDPISGSKVVSGNLYYLHDRPNLTESQVIWKMNAEAWAVSTNGGNTWNGGMTVNGDVIARIISAQGLNAEWITTGQLESRNGNFYADLDTGEVICENISIFSNNFDLSPTGNIWAQNASISGTLRSVSGNEEVRLYSGGLDCLYNNKILGRIGSNLETESNKRGLSFMLESNGDHMMWVSKDKTTDAYYSPKLAYFRSKLSGYHDADSLNIGCTLDMHNYTLKNVAWEDPGVTGTVSFVRIISMNSNGTVNSWKNNCSLKFKNGILIEGNL